MAGFEFKLQSFLSVKEKIEEQRKLEYGKALKKLDEAQEIKNELLKRKEKAVSEFKESLNMRINPEKLQRYNLYIDHIKNKIIEQEKVIFSLKAAAEKKRSELVEAMKERKMLDTLKEKAKVEYNIELIKKEQKVTDEIVSYQYNDKG